MMLENEGKKERLLSQKDCGKDGLEMDGWGGTCIP